MTSFGPSFLADPLVFLLALAQLNEHLGHEHANCQAKAFQEDMPLPLPPHLDASFPKLSLVLTSVPLDNGLRVPALMPSIQNEVQLPSTFQKDPEDGAIIPKLNSVATYSIELG